MNWHADKFRQPIAAVESLAKMYWRGHPYEGYSGHPKGICLVMGQPRCREKPILHLLDGRSNLR